MADDPLDQLDYYTLLGVADDASVEAIKQAFRKFARKFHPDRVEDEAMRERATRIFRRGSEALQVLTDGAQRAAYDRALQQGKLRLTEDGPGSSERVDPKPAAPPSGQPVRTTEGLAHFRRAVEAAKTENWRGAYAALVEANRVEPNNPFLQNRLQQVEALLRGR